MFARLKYHLEGRKRSAVGVLFLALGALIYFVFLPYVSSYSYVAKVVEDVSATVEQEIQKVVAGAPRVAHKETPENVKALYMSQCAAATPSYREHVFSLLDETELNSVVVDIKDYTGTVAFIRRDADLEEEVGGGGCRVKDMKEYVEELHKRNVYVIGRITVFQDPYLANKHPEWAVQRSDGSVWKDRKGLSFIDVGAKGYWEWIIELSKESYELGFDEINFDYIRYPSDGQMSDIVFPHSGHKDKEDALEDFFIYLHDSLQDTGIVTSADIFGMTTTAEDGMGIGQVLERTLPYFDYVAPMVYPSHYPAHFNGWANPNTVPGDLIRFVMGSAVERAAATSTHITLRTKPLAKATSTDPTLYPKPVWPKEKLRTWIQDFDYGGTYDAAAVRAQIDASYDVGVHSWMLWDPAVEYTREALKSE